MYEEESTRERNDIPLENFKFYKEFKESIDAKFNAEGLAKDFRNVGSFTELEKRRQDAKKRDLEGSSQSEKELRELDLFQVIQSFLRDLCDETFEGKVEISEFNEQAGKANPDFFAIMSGDEYEDGYGYKNTGLLAGKVKLDFSKDESEEKAFHQLIRYCFSRDTPTMNTLHERFPWFGLAIDNTSVFGVVLEFDEKLQEEYSTKLIKNPREGMRLAVKAFRTKAYKLSEKEGPLLIAALIHASIQNRAMKVNAKPKFDPFEGFPMLSEPCSLVRVLAGNPYFIGELKDSKDESYLFKINFVSDETQMKTEANILSVLNAKDCPSIPKKIYYGPFFSKWSLLLTQPVGEPLSRFMNPVFPPELYREVAETIEKALLFIHECGVIHADICPANMILVRCGSSWEARLIDFGGSFLLGTPKEDLPGIVGHSNTSSVAAMMDEPLTFEDDFESLVYTLTWLSKGSLPWEKELDSHVFAKKRHFLSNLKSSELIPDRLVSRVLKGFSRTKDLKAPIFSNGWGNIFLRFQKSN